MTTFIEERSPDGLLTLIAEEYLNEDGSPGVLLGFDCGPWHIHPPEHVERSPFAREWAQNIVADVVGNRMLIVRTRGDGFEQVRLAGELEFEFDVQPSETVSFRFWNGLVVTIEDLIDGKVAYLPLPFN